MNVTFFTFSKRINSTKRPTGGTSYGVTLKEGCSALRPSIRLVWPGSGSPTAYNYAYISDFGRYYWVQNWTFEDRQWTADLAVDVLATYKTDIGSSSQYVTRSASQYDGSIIDQLYPTKSQPSVQNSSTSFWSTPGAVADQTFLVCTAGRSGFMDYYLLNGSALAELGAEVFSVTFYDGMDLGVITPEVIKAITDPEESVIAITYLPVTWSQVSGQGTAVSSFYLGYYEFTINGSGSAMRHIRPSTSITLTKQLSISPHPDAATRGAYLNGDAYTVRTLFVPTMGTINLDNNVLQGCDKIDVSATLNLASGMCNCVVYGYETGAVNPRRRLLATETQVGVPYGFGARTIDVKDNMTAVTSAVTDAATGNYVGAVAGIIGALQMSKPKLTILGRSGSIASFALGILLEEVFYRPVDEDNTNHGRPLCKVVTINTLSGYIRCQNAEISLAGTDEEQDAVVSYMNGGFFYE